MRARGEEWHDTCGVELLAVTDETVEALEAGSYLYRVTLRGYRTRHMVTSCGCPDGRAGFTCRHLWATLLAVDACGGVKGEHRAPVRARLLAGADHWRSTSARSGPQDPPPER